MISRVEKDLHEVKEDFHLYIQSSGHVRSRCPGSCSRACHRPPPTHSWSNCGRLFVQLFPSPLHPGHGKKLLCCDSSSSKLGSFLTVLVLLTFVTNSGAACSETVPQKPLISGWCQQFHKRGEPEETIEISIATFNEVDPYFPQI